MNSGLRFLIAAKRCEITDLQHLAHTSALVRAVGRLVHGLQRERGLTNLQLASLHNQWATALEQQIADSEGLQAQVLACFEGMGVEMAAPRLHHGARLFSRIAYALQGIASLPALRLRLRGESWAPERASAAYTRLISGLLSVVFEAADTAADPGISRQLVALFNFMQGKELTGQERATGSALFAAGQANAAAQQNLLRLIDSEERCLQVFGEFASPTLLQAWKSVQRPEQLAALERMRRQLCTAADGAPLDRQLSQPWFDANTAVIDTMKTIEDQMAVELLNLCVRCLRAAEGELSAFEALNGHNSANPTGSDSDISFFEQVPPTISAHASALGASTPDFGPALNRSILELVQDQSRRLQSMGQELDTVRASLNERKVIERAKGLLMAHRHLSEEEAHKRMRQMAMNQNRRLVEVAEALLSMAEVLPEPQR